MVGDGACRLVHCFPAMALDGVRSSGLWDCLRDHARGLAGSPATRPPRAPADTTLVSATHASRNGHAVTVPDSGTPTA
jgi:hypothetical protein